MAGKIVTVTEGIDGTMGILYQDRSIKFRNIDVRPEQPQKQKVKIRRRAAYIPPADHPMEEVQNRQKCLPNHNGGSSVETGHFHFGLTETLLQCPGIL